MTRSASPNGLTNGEWNVLQAHPFDGAPLGETLPLTGFRHILNKGEALHALKWAVAFHRNGEIRDRSFEAQSNRASGLNLVATAIAVWNTVYLGRAVGAPAH